MAEPIRIRNYTCYSPACEGFIMGIDKVPKPFGRAAQCWCCNDDRYTLPRFGASNDYVVGRPGVTENMTKTSHPSVIINPGGWLQGFAGLINSRPASASQD